MVQTEKKRRKREVESEKSKELTNIGFIQDIVQKKSVFV
jgi:hypothetical protein